jgi:hypothetical protein
MTDYMITETVTYDRDDAGWLVGRTKVTVYEELPPEEDETPGLADVPLRSWPFGVPSGIMPCKGSPNIYNESVADFAAFKNRKMTDGYL